MLSATAQRPSASNAATSNAAEYLTFRLGQEEYGIDILRVQEIRGYDAVTRIANTPDYLKGVINFNDDLGFFSFLTRQDLSERDQQAARDAYESFRQLSERFPESQYTPDAKLRMNYIVNSLAQYEVHVARYYLSRGAYVAAANRAQSALTDFHDVPALEEALFILVRAYDAMGLNQLRDDARRVLEKSYPRSEYLTRGFKSANNPWWKLW